jgi:hypothetical protein
MPCAEINRDAVWTERMSEEREIQILLTSWFMTALSTIMILMGRVVCGLLHKAKTHVKIPAVWDDKMNVRIRTEVFSWSDLMRHTYAWYQWLYMSTVFFGR